MNYRHIYHAGNFADIIKHIVLIATLEQLKKKEKPFAVLDAFAGTGQYNLASELALKTGESSNGIKKLLSYDQSLHNIPAILKIFLDIVHMMDKDHYPGSPLIIKHLLRHYDQLIAAELHVEDYLSLKKLFARNNNVHIHNIDAYQAVKAYIPFKENRGVIFLDPPFEVKDEFSKLLAIMKIIKHRAPNICSLIWYPIKNLVEVRNFYRNHQTIGFKESLIIEYELLDSPKNMIKCGLLIVNPPNIQAEITNIMDCLVSPLMMKFTSKII